jgi:hypothetical protein
MFLWALIPAGLSLIAVMNMGNTRLIIPAKAEKEQAVKTRVEMAE